MELRTIPSQSKYVRDFDALFVPIRGDIILDKARSGTLAACQFRSVCWRYFLECLPKKYEDWFDSCASTRKNYDAIKQKHFPNKVATRQTQQQPSDQPESKNILNDGHGDANLPPNNTLTDTNQKQQASTNECDQNKNLYNTIERDVIRTFPDMEFFRLTEIQGILVNVLYNYACENPYLSYKQGMHELLATLLFVIHTDAQNCLIHYQGGYANEAISNIVDLRYVEHDAYFLFRAMMKSIETWYQNDERLSTVETQFRVTSQNNNRANSNRQPNSYNSRQTYAIQRQQQQQQQSGSVLGVKFKRISDKIVKNYDTELYNHLEALQIAPQIYGIRWMRLLFGREFDFHDLLAVWDAIICDHIPMSLTDYIFASMLITIRERLVNGDYTDCLNNLMRYQFKDAQRVINLALYLRDPSYKNKTFRQ